MKRKFLAMSLVSVLFVSSIMPSLALTGGWDEENGYYKTPTSYEQNLKKNINFNLYNGDFTALNTPRHTGKKETTVISGTTNYRAHGWTTWVGETHYTRAMMTNWYNEKDIYTDSGRVWGKDGTEATSLWYAFNPDQSDKARTYYGN